MKTPASLVNKLTHDIERSIIDSKDDGLMIEAIMREFKVGRTCVRNHLKVLEDAGRIHRVKRTRTRKRFGSSTTYSTFHACDGNTPLDAQPACRDWLVEAFFGPARREAA